MKTVRFQLQMVVPDVQDFSDDYPQYGGLAGGSHQFLFDLLTTPQAFAYASMATVALELPAIAGVAKLCYEAVQAQSAITWTPITKQFIGAVVASVMCRNGFSEIR